jgi:8-oxo-dGTP pyrophosphatase MutT (NUDIX family)
MFHNNRSIRPLTVAIIKNDKGEILVSPGYDSLSGQHFYRLLGGGIEFGEKSIEALHREFKEELAAELINCRLLKVYENIFSFNGEEGHEICFIYQADFSDPALYQKKDLLILDSTEDGSVIWLDLKERGDRHIYPDINDLL